MLKEYIIQRFYKRYSSLTLETELEDHEYSLFETLEITCNKCKQKWQTKIINILLFRAICRNCLPKGSSTDEIKILSFIREYYIPKDEQHLFKTAEEERLVIYPEPIKNKSIIGGGYLVPPFYTPDAYSSITYYIWDGIVDKSKKLGMKGSLFEILGDYYHSNPLFFDPDTYFMNGMTHGDNYNNTMKRFAHLREQGYIVFHIWISDFRLFIRNLIKAINGKTTWPIEESIIPFIQKSIDPLEPIHGGFPNLMKYVNLCKHRHRPKTPDITLLPEIDRHHEKIQSHFKSWANSIKKKR